MLTLSRSANDPNTSVALAGMILLSGVGNLGISFMPFIVSGAIESFNWTVSQAGNIATAELAGFALGSLLISTRIHVWNRRVIALGGVLLVVSGNLASISITAYEATLLARLAAGIGSAMAYSGYTATAAASLAPDRAFGIVNATSIIASGAFIWAAPYLLGQWGLTGLYFSIAALAALSAVGLLMIPEYGPHRPRNEELSTNNLVYRKSVRRGILLSMAVLFFAFVGHYGIWTFHALIGSEANISPGSVGFWLMVSRITGLLGSLLAGYWALRFGRIWPLSTCLALAALSTLLLVTSTNTFTFALSSCVFTAALFFCLPYQQGLLSAFDPHGRANVAGDFMTTSGGSIGPWLGGMLISNGSYLGVGWLAIVSFFLCWALLLPAVRILSSLRLERRFV